MIKQPVIEALRFPRGVRLADKAAALAVLRAHAQSLQHDGFIEFGLMFQQGGKTEEVFVKGGEGPEDMDKQHCDRCADSVVTGDSER